MANTYTRLISHVTFSTQFRRRYIDESWENELHAYLGGTLNKQGCQSITVGGYVDHVHLVFHCPPRLALSSVVQNTKKASTGWVREKFGIRRFSWQEGFGGFSVDHNNIDRVIQYVKNQKEHHKTRRFDQEYRELVAEHGIEIDERFLLDPEDETPV